VRQQKLINSSPKKALKEIFRDKKTQPRAGLQALRDPYTGILETEPIKQIYILEKFYKDSWKKKSILIMAGICLILTDPPFSFLVKGLFFPSGPFSLIDARSFLLLA